MSENETVQVAVRIRPMSENETSKGSKNILDVFPEVSQIKVQDKAFTYNQVFEPETEQNVVYEKSVKKFLKDIFNGYNVTILAYGQTGSGKTYTMGTTYSTSAPMGIIPLAVNEIFTYIKDNFSTDFTVSVTFMELYQEVLYDLLADKPRDQCTLDIREDIHKEIVIPGLTKIGVDSADQVFASLMRGAGVRVTGSTNMNSQSSRSHAIFTINLAMQDKNNKSNNKTAKLHFVDLAGSERPKKTGAVGTTFKEGVNINKGLLVLGNVISALGDDKQKDNFIPYRDSNLTRLLKDSLGGNSITLMIACVSPADYNADETISTLRYADRARKIKNKPIINQDPKTAEINELKKTVQKLRLQILGHGGPDICPGEYELLKKDNQDLRCKIRDLTNQLSSTLNGNTGLLEKIMILQNANEVLHKKINELKDEYNITLNEISIGFDQNDTEAIRKNIDKLQKMQMQFVELDAQQKQTENDMFTHEQNLELPGKPPADELEAPEMHEDDEHFTHKQMALNNELLEINKNLAIKEQLARQITSNAQYLVDYKGLAENEAKMASMQKERDQLLQQLKTAQTQGASSKIAEQRRKRVQELESHIHDLNRKVLEQARLIKIKEKDEVKIKKLNSEIVQMKQCKIKLIRKMREEMEAFRIYKIQRDKEVNKLKQQDKKQKFQLVKMEAINNKQQNVLKRKVEEATALNKRLKESLSLRKAARDGKNAGKSEKIGPFIKHEVEVYTQLVEAETTLAGLLEDRATLQHQLDALKQDPEADPTQIKSIEDDIEMRSVQIQDLQQKMLDSDEEIKGKARFENIQVMGDAKQALKIMLEQTGDLKRQEIHTRLKLLESQANQHELIEKNQTLEKVVKLMEYKHADELAQIQQENEEKFSVLLRQLRGVEVEDAKGELDQRCAIYAERVDSCDKANQSLMAQILEYESKIQSLEEKLADIGSQSMAQKVETAGHDEFLTPEPFKKKCKITKQVDSTFTYADTPGRDLSFEEACDDTVRDPDWQHTPLGKWLVEKKRRTVTQNDLPVKLTYKRNSEGGCTCSKSNCSSRCGCKKNGQSCTANCKCAEASCRNRNKENQLSVIDDSDIAEKKARLTRGSIFPLNDSVNLEF